MSAFPTTRWTLILSAQKAETSTQEAWKFLFERYGRPLYAYFRAKGLDATASSDAVQGFYVEMIERDTLEKLNPQRGRLRGFLKVAAENYLLREREKQQAAKRGSHQTHIELDSALAERLSDANPASTPDAAFDRAWAWSIFERALQSLEREMQDKPDTWKIVRLFFAPQNAPPSYQEVAAQFQLSVPKLKSMLHRARLRFRAHVEEEVAQTIENTEDLEQETALMLEALTS